MPNTNTGLAAGQDRFVQTMVQTGVSRDMAYTLAEDVRVMAGTAVDKSIAAQESAIDSKVAEIDRLKNAVEEGMKVQNAVIGGLSTTIVESFKLQNAKIDAQNDRMDAQNDRIDAQNDKIDKLATTVAESVKLQNVKMDAQNAKIGAQNDKIDAQTTQIRAFMRLFSNQQDAIKSLERRIEAHHSEMVAPMFKFVWAIIGSGLLALLALFSQWLIKAFGLF